MTYHPQAWQWARMRLARIRLTMHAPWTQPGLCILGNGGIRTYRYRYMVLIRKPPSCFQHKSHDSQICTAQREFSVSLPPPFQQFTLQLIQRGPEIIFPVL